MVVTFVAICIPRVVVMFVAICVPRVVVLVRSTDGCPEFLYAGCKFVFGELYFQIFFYFFQISDGMMYIRRKIPTE